MTKNDLKIIADKIVAMKRFSTLTQCQTGRSQGALIKSLTAEETATVAQLVLEMMTDESHSK
jgi:hypothetical protein